MKETFTISTATADEELRSLPSYQRIGFLNGMFLALAVGLGAWGRDILSFSSLPVTSPYPSLLIGLVVLMLCGSVVGWLTARTNRAGVTILGWLGTAVLLIYIIAVTPFQSKSLIAWLIDARYAGLPVYSRPDGNLPLWMLLYGGFFTLLTLTILAALQEYRLEGVHRELGKNGHLSLRSWVQLLLPFPLVAIAGGITNVTVGDSTGTDLRLVYLAIEVSRTYDGDLFAKGIEDGINYNAFRGLQDQLTADYTLAVGEVDTVNGTTYVVAHFDTGAWITCRVTYEQLSFCYDASPPYTIGLHSLITGVQPSQETCRGCLPRVGDEWQAWFAANRWRFGEPQISFISQQGAFVFVEAASETGDYVVECRFSGIQVVRLQGCEEP